MSRSLGYYTFTGSSSVTDGTALPLTSTVRQTGKNLSLSNNAVNIGYNCDCASNPAGYYTVSANVTLTASSAGTASVLLYQNGSPVPGAYQTVTTAISDVANFSFTAPIRVYCGQNNTTLQLMLTGQDVTATNVAIEVVKE